MKIYAEIISFMLILSICFNLILVDYLLEYEIKLGYFFNQVITEKMLFNDKGLF